jgi:PPM family protein phosphatase
MRIESAGWTHVGRRSHNEDAWVSRGNLGLFVVADGLGGYEGGEVASRCVVDTFAGFCERVTNDPEATWPHRLRPGHSREEDLLFNCTLLAQRSILARRVGHLWDTCGTWARPWWRSSWAHGARPWRTWVTAGSTGCAPEGWRR